MPGRGGHRRPHRLHFAVWLRREAGGSASSPQVRCLGRGRTEEPARPRSGTPRHSPPPGLACTSRGFDRSPGPAHASPGGLGLDGARGSAPARGSAGVRPSEVQPAPGSRTPAGLPWRCGARTSAGGLGRSRYRDSGILGSARSSHSPPRLGEREEPGAMQTARSGAGQRPAGPVKAAEPPGVVPAGRGERSGRAPFRCLAGAGPGRRSRWSRGGAAAAGTLGRVYRLSSRPARGARRAR